MSHKTCETTAALEQASKTSHPSLPPNQSHCCRSLRLEETSTAVLLSESESSSDDDAGSNTSKVGVVEGFVVV